MRRSAPNFNVAKTFYDQLIHLSFFPDWQVVGDNGVDEYALETVMQALQLRFFLPTRALTVRSHPKPPCTIV